MMYVEYFLRFMPDIPVHNRSLSVISSRFMRRLGHVVKLCLVVALSGLCMRVQAQSSVTLSGRITDEAQKPVSRASVRLDGTPLGTGSDENGCYRLQLPAGKYSVTVSALGYDSQQMTFEIREQTRLDFCLKEQVVGLSAVEVYGKTKAQRLREGSFTVNAIDVKSYAHSLNNLNDLIGRSSGVKIREDGGVGADFDLSVNGLSGNAIRYFIDGIPMSSVGNGITLANFPINLVERVDIYKGVVPAELGTDALGGAVNIITKKAIRNYVDVSYGLGSFHTHKADLSTQYIERRTGIFLKSAWGVNYSKNDYTMRGVEVPDEAREGFRIIDAKRFHDDYFSVLGQLHVGVTNKKWADLLSLAAYCSRVDTELQTGSVQTKVYGMAERQNKAFSLSLQYRKQNFLVRRLSADFSLSHTWDHTVVTDTAFRKYDWTGHYIEASRNEITGRGKSIRNVKRPLIVGRANFGYLWNENHSFHLNYLLNRVGNERTDDFDADFVPSTDTFGKHVIGLSYRQSFGEDRWNNTFFVKDYISRLKIGQQDLSWISGSGKMPDSSTSVDWGYGFSTRLRLSEWLAVKASAERSVRLPLAREYMGNGSTVYPNFLLRPENSRNCNFGVFGTLNLASRHRLFYEAGLFYRGVEDYIRFVITEDEGTGQYRNVKSATVKGVEGELRYEYDHCLQAIANISYLDEKSKTRYLPDGKPDVTYNNRIPNKPWLYGNVELNFKKRNIFGQKESQLKASYYFQYVHWFYLTWKGYGSVSSKSRIPTQCINSASVTCSFRNERYNIALECSNLFDRPVYDNYMMQKQGRSFWGKLRVFIH